LVKLKIAFARLTNSQDQLKITKNYHYVIFPLVNTHQSPENCMKKKRISALTTLALTLWLAATTV